MKKAECTGGADLAERVVELDSMELAVAIFGKTFRSHDLVQGIIQGPQIRIYLALQISRQKSQLFARFHCRAREDNAAHILAFKCFYRHCNRQIGFARARRANTKCDGMVTDRAQIFFLAQCFGANRKA